VYTGSDGIRRFIPREKDGIPGYVARAFQYGHSLLARERHFDWNRWCYYLVAKHAFDRLEHVQERIETTFASSDALNVRKTLRAIMGYDDVLPDHVGRPADDVGGRWSVADLLKEGRRAAVEVGVTKPSDAETIAYGLLEAAKLNPVCLPDAEVETLVRMSLYDFSRSGSKVSAEETEQVWQRLHDWIRNHLYDEREQFKKTFFGKGSNLVRAIANQARAEGGKLSRPVVKRALHDLGWRGYRLVGECLETFARAFSRALPKPLSDREHAYFQAMYYRQAYLGGLPLALVMERRNFVQPAIVQLWENPGDKALTGALHQLLRYYSEMVPIYREAERLKKRVPAGFKSGAFKPGTEGLIAARDGDRSLLDLAYGELIERHGIECRACHKAPRGRLILDRFREARSFMLEAICEEHGPIQSVEIAWEEIQSLRPLFMDQPRSDEPAGVRRRANHALSASHE
jgi:hypothetical protein